MAKGGKHGREFFLFYSDGTLSIDFQTVPEEVAQVCKEKVKAVREDAASRA